MIRHTPKLCDWCDQPATVVVNDAPALRGHSLACPVHSVAVHLPRMLSELSA